MLIVLSSPLSVKNEAALINRLLDAGLELFHLRKPDLGLEELRQLISGILPVYHSRLVLHQYHELATVFAIRRLHFTETSRKALKETELPDLKKRGFHLSASLHSFKDYEDLAPGFDYVFLGPVFDSISKKGYKAADLKNGLPPEEKRQAKLIALGGITRSNLNTALSWGFNGVAVLGSIWESESPVDEFIQIRNTCKPQESMS